LFKLSFSFTFYPDPLTSLVNLNHFSDFHSHTKGHISYYVTGKEDEDPAVFTGDTLVSLSTFFNLMGCFERRLIERKKKVVISNACKKLKDGLSA